MTVRLVVYPADATDSPEDLAEQLEVLIVMERVLPGTVYEFAQHFVGELVGGLPSGSMFAGEAG